jgi:DNA polymerase III delta subunit
MGLYGNYFFTEETLTTEKRNNMQTKTFGLPKERKYPLNDKKHVLSAITYFNKCDPDKEEELARNIKKRIKELGMSPNVSEDGEITIEIYK